MSRIFSTILVAAALTLTSGTSPIRRACPARHVRRVLAGAGTPLSRGQHVRAVGRDHPSGQVGRLPDRRGARRPVRKRVPRQRRRRRPDHPDPRHPALPTYSGSYREKVNAIVIGVEGDLARVGRFRLRAPLAGSDGSGLMLTMSDRFTLNALGELVAERFSFTCA